MSGGSARPAVTVIMTVLNGERTIRESVTSVLSQTLREFELVVVDDGSTDGTAGILAELAADPRVKLLQRGHLGRQPALNVAWREGAGEFVANLDADDRSAPERLERQVSFLREHPEVGVVGTRCTMLDEGSSETSDPALRAQVVVEPRELVCSNPIVHSSVMMRRSVLEEVGGYDERFRMCEDYDLWVRIAARHALAVLPERLTLKRVSESAFFRNRISRGEMRYARAKIRWQAWWRFSRRPADLRFVLQPAWGSLARFLPSMNQTT